MGKFPKSILGIILVITLLNIVVGSLGLEYPKARRDEKIVDDYHGTKVPDPYRWLEKPKSERVGNFVEAQNELTYNYLSDCQQRKQFRDRLNELWTYAKYGRPEKRGNRYFYFAQQRGGEVLHVQDTRDSQPRALINPQENGLMAFPNMGVSRNGEFVVYKDVLTIEGYPRVTGNLRVMNVTNGTVFPDVLEDVRNPQIAWDKDSRGFFYFSHRRYDGSDEADDETLPPPKIYIYYHRVGTKQEEDVLAVDYADLSGEPSFVDIETSEDAQYLMIKTRAYSGTPRSPKTNSTFYVSNIAKFESSGVTERLGLDRVFTKRNSPFLKYVTNIGQLFYFRSRIENTNYKLVEVDLANPAEGSWRTVIEENPNFVLQYATAVDKNKVIVSYTSEKLNSFAELRYLQNGTLLRLFPLQFGELLSFSGNIQDSEVLFRSTKLEGLPELYYFDAMDVKGPMKQLVKQPKITNYEASEYVSEVVTFPSADGSNVEMILAYRKDLKRDGSAYAFIVEREFDLDFYFRVYFSYMKDFNAVIAFPHLEESGGVGFRESALEDFIASAEYLIQHGYANSSRIITRGQSTFGLFTAAAANRRPDLFAAVMPSLVAFDMLRYEAFTNWTGGQGSSEDPESFKRTYEISPLHNIRIPANDSVQYPAIFVPTTNEYPVPLAFKYIAELQNSLGGNPRQTNPFLLRVVPEPRDAIDIEIFARYNIDRETDVRCFLEKTIGLRLAE